MSETTTGLPIYVFNRPANESSVYTMWQVDLANPNLFSIRMTSPNASLPDGWKVIQVGGFLLTFADASYSPTQMAWKLMRFTPALTDPLNNTPVQTGCWDATEKFMGFYKHYDWDHDALVSLQLLPMNHYVLQFMPTPARRTYCLWNFDPQPQAQGDDPPDALTSEVTPADAFPFVDNSSQLIPMNNYVLEWIRSSNMVRQWSFDPQSGNPLSYPSVSTTTAPWAEGSCVAALGPYVLAWDTVSLEFTLYKFIADPAQGPFAEVRSGVLPRGFNPHGWLGTASSTYPPEAPTGPGSLDFMRSKIDKVIVYMVESRTYDNVLGWLYENSDPSHFVNASLPVQGNSLTNSNPGQSGEPVYVSLFEDGHLSTEFDLECPVIDPFHGTPDSVWQQWSGGYADYQVRATPDMQGFVTNNADDVVMKSLSTAQLPVLNGLAESFGSCDNWFSPLPGGTDSNRAFALTGSAYNLLKTYEGPPEYDNFHLKVRRPSLFRTLWTQGMTDMTIYYSVLWYDHVFTWHLYAENELPSMDANRAGLVQELSQFKADCANGTLPTFSFLEPVWIAPSGSTSYHPGGDLVPPEVALNEIYQAVVNSPDWERTAFIITFSKGGGVYDHVPPPFTNKPWPNDGNDGFEFDVCGPRVPFIVVSPYVLEKTLFRGPGGSAMDATSLPATILSWLGVPRWEWGMGDRLDHAPTFEGVFNAETARTDKPAFTNPYDKSYPPSSDS